jgi:hypothetical protein
MTRRPGDFPPKTRRLIAERAGYRCSKQHGPALQEWVDTASAFARTLPPKPARGTASRERR